MSVMKPTIIENAPVLDPQLLKKVTVLTPSRDTQPLYLGKPVHPVPVPVLVSKEVIVQVMQAIRGETDARALAEEFSAEKYAVTGYTEENGAMRDVTVIPERRSVRRLLLPAALNTLGYDQKYTDLIGLQYALTQGTGHFTPDTLRTTPQKAQEYIASRTSEYRDVRAISIHTLATMSLGLMKRLEGELSQSGATTCKVQNDVISRQIVAYFMTGNTQFSLGNDCDANGTVRVKKNEFLTDTAVYDRGEPEGQSFFQTIRAQTPKNPQ